jgi:hypothetical protein
MLALHGILLAIFAIGECAEIAFAIRIFIDSS